MDRQENIFRPVRTPHPGEVIIDYLDAHGWTQSDLARRSGLTPKTISEICNGKAPVTPPTALAFEKIFQRPAHLWLNLQARFEEAQARGVSEAKTVEWESWAKKFPLAEWASWAQRFPLKEMKRYKWISPLQKKGSEVDALLSFLGVSSPESWEQVWGASQISYRQTRRFNTSKEAIAVWVRASELLASEVGVGEFDGALLRQSLVRLRNMTRESVPKAVSLVQEICGAAGVAVVWVPELERTGISGCARWLSNRRAMIALTLRYKTDDQMWFTFFHELGHLLLHGKTLQFVLDNAAESLTDNVVDPQMQRNEEEANRFAADTLIPPEALHEFLRHNDFGNSAIHEFSEKVGVGPGLVVGRLQHDGVLAPHQGNKLKQSLEWRIEND